MKNYKYEISMKDRINNLVHKMFDASTFNGESYDSLLRELSFELDMDDDEVDKMFNTYVDRELSTYDNLQALTAHLYYLYLENN
jgi:hypothetical protein